jgi:radical SAM superfamily enzyme YgiQ (UPF0313 family)
VASTGFDEISLTSLSASGHPGLCEILDDLHFSLRDLGVSVVLSSMRPEAFSGPVAGRLRRLKSGGLTFAPETPSARLKKVIGKNIKNAEIIKVASMAKEMGWKKIKLYFMIGLPGETMEDIKGIVDFIKEVKRKSAVHINVSVNPLTPQAHTPFQWLKCIDPDELAEKIEYISSKAPARVSSFCKEKYIVENILTRGGKNCAEIVYRAAKEGALLQQSQRFFRFEPWEKAFKETGSSWQEYYFREFDIKSRLPWDYVDTGIKKSYLKKQYKSAMEAAADVE